MSLAEQLLYAVSLALVLTLGLFDGAMLEFRVLSAFLLAGCILLVISAWRERRCHYTRLCATCKAHSLPTEKKSVSPNLGGLLPRAVLVAAVLVALPTTEASSTPQWPRVSLASAHNTRKLSEFDLYNSYTASSGSEIAIALASLEEDLLLSITGQCILILAFGACFVIRIANSDDLPNADKSYLLGFVSAKGVFLVLSVFFMLFAFCLLGAYAYRIIHMLQVYGRHTGDAYATSNAVCMVAFAIFFSMITLVVGTITAGALAGFIAGVVGFLVGAAVGATLYQSCSCMRGAFASMVPTEAGVISTEVTSLKVRLEEKAAELKAKDDELEGDGVADVEAEDGDAPAARPVEGRVGVDEHGPLARLGHGHDEGRERGEGALEVGVHRA